MEGVKRRDWILFGLTFITGMFLGVFMYITTFKPIYAPEALNTAEDSALEFSVVGLSYGGFQSAEYVHPTFRVLGDGTYTFIPGGTSGENRESIDGALPRALMKNIKSEIDKGTLIVSSAPAISGDCRSFADGIDYQYQILLDGEDYTLDTCSTELAYGDDLALVLEEVWNYLHNPEAGYQGGNGISETPAEKLGDYLKDQFDTAEN